MTVERPIDAVAAGHICLDIIPRFPESAPAKIDEIFTPGKLVFMDRAAVSTGGSVSNTGIALSILGMQVAYSAKVGNDFFGRGIIELLQQRGLTDGVAVSDDEGTSYTVVVAPHNIDRIFLHSPGTNHTYRSADVKWDLVEQARMFHFGYPPLMRSMFADGGDELATIFQRAKDAGTTTSLDMAMPDPGADAGQADWNTIFDKTLPHVDLFIPSAEEVFLMTERADYLKRREAAAGDDLLDHITQDDIERWAQACIARGVAVVGIKCGHLGLYCRTGSAEQIAAMGAAAPADPAAWADRELWCPAYVVEQIASATGAGDAAYAGFLTAFARGMTLEQCLCMANTTGAMNLSELDALSGLRAWDETRATMQQPPWPVREVELGDGWTFDAAARVWRKG